MGAAKQVRPLTLEEYLALEREAPVKHELVEGFPHAMAGTGDRHNRVVVNLVLALGPLARKRGCRLYASDMRLKVDAATVYYPDLMLRRRPRGILQGKGLPGDRGALALHGGHGPEGKALQVPGSAHPPSLPPPGLPHPRAFGYYREGEGWVYREAEVGTLPLPCLGGHLDLAEVYQGL